MQCYAWRLLSPVSSRNYHSAKLSLAYSPNRHIPVHFDNIPSPHIDMAGAHAYSSSFGLDPLREPSANFNWSDTSEYDQVPANAIGFQPDLLQLIFAPGYYPALSTGGIPGTHHDPVTLLRQLRDMLDQLLLSVQPFNSYIQPPAGMPSTTTTSLNPATNLNSDYQALAVNNIANQYPINQFDGLTTNLEITYPDFSTNPPIPSASQSAGGAESLIVETSQTNTPSMQPSASRGSISASETTSNSKEHSHRCDSCDKSFRRPYLLKDHKRKCIDEATKVYPCQLEGCTRAYTSKSNLARHVRESHSRAGNTHSSLPASDGRVLDEFSAQPPLPGPSTHSMRGSTNMRRSGQGTPSSGNVRFCPYETPDSVRNKLTKRKK